ncbi:MAG: T9SS type A sorting domain-containing protein [Bacteroidales bacterium]|nr:T9SS type A sorting domain-containing protein [Bacteroidales bacterium]
MRNIILRLGSDIVLRQNGSTVTTVTRGQPLTVNYSVNNAGSQTWLGYVSLWIEQSDGTLSCIQGESQNGVTSLEAGRSQSFTFSNNGVISPVGTTKLYVKVKNFNAGGYYGERDYDVGSLTGANPLVFQIVEGGGGGSDCTVVPDYDYSRTVSTSWNTHTSSIESECWKIYRFSVSPDYSYCFKTGCGDGASADFDTKLFLYNSNGTQIASDDDGCSNYTSKIEYTPDASGYVYLKVAGYSDEYGNYTLAYIKNSNHNCTAIPDYDYSKTAYTTWSTHTSSIESECWKIYRFSVSPDYSYCFKTGCGDGASADFDTQLYLYNQNGTEVAFDDDECSNYTSKIEYTPNASGYVYLKVAGYSTEYGDYTLAYKKELLTPITYTISVSASPSAAGTVSGGGQYASGNSCTLTATANTGYTFTRWTKNGSSVSTNPTYSFTVTENASYVAVFSQNSYTISTSANPTAGGSVSGAGTYNYGSTCTLTATANTGYTFTRWTKNGSSVSTNPTYSFTVTGNASYVAVFSQNSYAISASANPTAGGSVSGAGTYNYGSTCTLTATANTGYTFTRWTKNGSSVSTNPTYSFTVTGNASYVAVFSQNSYAISASANPTAGGSVSGAGTYNYGSTCTLTATANTGYIFTNWTKNGTVVSTNANYGFTVTSNATYVANFESNGGNYHWIVDGGQYASTMTVLGVIRVNGVEQTETTLEVGAFCGSQCRGRERITYVPQINRYLLFLTIYGEDGNGITFRLYDHALGRELTQNCTTTVNFVTNGTLGTVSTPYPIEFSDAIVQTTSLEEGWNWWSTYIEQEGIDGLEQMEESLGENGIMIKSRNDGFVTNYGGFWLGSLLDVNNENTYLIQTNSACVMSLTGGATAASSHPIALPMGWSWIGYPNNTAMSVSTAMSGMSPKENDQLKSRESFSVYYPGIGWIGSLQTITPGMGLMFESHNTSTVTLTYPNASKSEDLKENVTARDNHWQPSMETYPDNMTVIAVVEADGVELASENYEIAAFAEGECRGSARLQYVASTGRYMAFLTIFGEKTAELGFGLYDIHTGEERYDTDNVMVYESNGSGGALFEPYKISFSEYTGVDELERLVQVYPNPVDCGQTLRVGVIVEKLSEVRIEIVDALGAVVSESTSTKMPATIKAPNAAGIYMLRIFVKGKGICCRKLVVK